MSKVFSLLLILAFCQIVSFSENINILAKTKYLVVKKKMKCISEIRKIIIDLSQEINDEIKAENIAGGFDNTWVEEMKLRLDILGELNKIVATYEFIVQQENQ